MRISLTSFSAFTPDPRLGYSANFHLNLKSAAKTLFYRKQNIKRVIHKTQIHLTLYQRWRWAELSLGGDNEQFVNMRVFRNRHIWIFKSHLESCGWTLIDGD